MIVRLTAAVLLTGLACATPSQAEVGAFSPELLLDAQGAETTALIARDLAARTGPAVSQVSNADAPMPAADVPSSDPTQPQMDAAVAPETSGHAPLEEEVEYGALAPELFLDRNEDETLSWTAAELSSLGELTTGSTTVHHTETDAFVAAAPIVINSLTDDALLLRTDLLP